MKGGGGAASCPLWTADGLRSDVGRAVVRKETSAAAWAGRVRGNVRAASEATALAENIVEFIFQVGGEVPPLAEGEEKVGGAGGWLLQGPSEGLTGRQQNSEQLQPLPSEAPLVSKPASKAGASKETLLVFPALESFPLILLIFQT